MKSTLWQTKYKGKLIAAFIVCFAIFMIGNLGKNISDDIC